LLPVKSTEAKNAQNKNESVLNTWFETKAGVILRLLALVSATNDVDYFKN